MRTFSFVLILMLTACKSTPPAADLMVVTSFAQFQNHLEKKVVLEGVYTQLNVNKRAGATPTFSGRITIELTDKRGVLLETHDPGIRLQEEIDKFEGKKVRVTGKISDNCLAWGNGEMASIVAPCITDLSDLELVK